MSADDIINDWFRKWQCCWQHIPANIPMDFPRILEHEYQRAQFLHPLSDDIYLRVCGTIYPANGSCPTCAEVKKIQQEDFFRMTQ